MRPWPNDGTCHCTIEELERVGREEEANLMAMCNGNRQMIAHVRLMCHNMIKAKLRRNVELERKALGADRRWGRRGGGVDALTYISRNLAPLFGKPRPRPFTRSLRRKTELSRKGLSVFQ